MGLLWRSCWSLIALLWDLHSASAEHPLDFLGTFCGGSVGLMLPWNGAPMVLSWEFNETFEGFLGDFHGSSGVEFSRGLGKYWGTSMGLQAWNFQGA